MPAQLFDPIQINGLKLSNRIIIAPMCQYSAAADGTATDWHTIHLGHLALSGAALMLIEATAVEADGRITASDLGLWSDDNERGLAKVLASVRANSSMPIGIQLAHAGRKSSHRAPWEGGAQVKIAEGGWLAHAPSPLPFQPGTEAPRGLDKAGLARVKAAFRKTDGHFPGDVPSCSFFQPGRPVGDERYCSQRARLWHDDEEPLSIRRYLVGFHRVYLEKLA